MGLVNPGILAGIQQPNILGALQQGQQMQRGLVQDQNQAQDDQRKEAFHSALSQILQAGVDYRTPDGQTKLLHGLATQGFGPEAMDLAQKMKTLAPSNPATTLSEPYLPRTTKDGKEYSYNRKTGKSELITFPSPAQPPADPTTPAALVVPWKGERFVRSKDNRMIKVDASGNDQNGNPVEVWQKPEKPSKTLGGAVSARSYISTFDKAKTNYEKNVAQPYLMVEGIKKSASYGTSLGDQSMIDQLVQMETNGKPTVAQYESTANNLGIADKFNRATKKFTPGEDGAILGPSSRKNLESQILEQTKQKHLAFSRELGQDSTMARAGGQDPGAVIRPGGYFDQVDQGIKNAGESNPTSAALPTYQQYDKIPSGGQYTDPHGNVRRKK